MISNNEFSTVAMDSSSMFSAINLLIKLAQIRASLKAKEAISLVPTK